MTRDEINKLSAYISSHSKCVTQVIETHISWVLLTNDFAYKIKKSVKFSFLDFSDLENRKYFCEKELALNKRLSDDVYLEVVPICIKDGNIFFGTIKDGIIDYAIKMRRLNTQRLMKTMLKNNEVKQVDVLHVADKIADFHIAIEKHKTGFNTEIFVKKFNDILHVKEIINTHTQKGNFIMETAKLSEKFIIKNKTLLQIRHEEGMTRDCHGDLHSGNIFLYDIPVIFDCIEFNDNYRIIDVLSDVAFFCMDLEARGHSAFSDAFMNYYLQKFQCLRNKDEEQLFLYYKLYRANVRAKVNAINTSQVQDYATLKTTIEELNRYLILMETYSKKIQL